MGIVRSAELQNCDSRHLSNVAQLSSLELFSILVRNRAMADGERFAYTRIGWLCTYSRGKFSLLERESEAHLPCIKFPPDTLDTVTVELFAAKFSVYLAGGDDAMMRGIDIQESREPLHLNARNVYYPRRLLSVTRFRSGRMQCRWRARAGTCEFVIPRGKRLAIRASGNETRK